MPQLILGDGQRLLVGLGVHAGHVDSLVDHQPIEMQGVGGDMQFDSLDWSVVIIHVVGVCRLAILNLDRIAKRLGEAGDQIQTSQLLQVARQSQLGQNFDALLEGILVAHVEDDVVIGNLTSFVPVSLEGQEGRGSAELSKLSYELKVVHSLLYRFH